MPPHWAPRFATPSMLTVTLLVLVGGFAVGDSSKCLPKQANSIPPQMLDPDAGSLETAQEFDAPSSPTIEGPPPPSGSLDLPATQPPIETFIESGSWHHGSSQSSSNVSTASSSKQATFGDVTSASGQCVMGNPNGEGLTREMVDEVWTRTMKDYIPPFKNLIFDQLITNQGKLSYCVRWDNDQKLTKAVASKFQEMLNRQMNLWHRWLVGYQCWPLEKVEITVVAFAVRDKSIMDWTDDSLGTIYEGVLDAEGSPQCPEECYKHQGQADQADTSACKNEPFDMSLWPSTKPGEGAIGTGGDWGQRVEVNDMLKVMDEDEMLVLLHEIGHGFGLPEMYEAKNKPADYPPCVMDNNPTLTHGDGWLLRSVLEHIKSRFDF